MLRLLLFVLLAYLVWRIVESALRLTGRQDPKRGDLRGSWRMTRKKPEQPYQDIRDADFEDLTPKKKSDEDPPSGS